MKLEQYFEVLDSLKNGNISDFKKWLKKATKYQLLQIIEMAFGHGYYKRHEIITLMQLYLQS
jgi:hypothetical protein